MCFTRNLTQNFAWATQHCAAELCSQPLILILTNSFAPRQGSCPNSQWGRWQGAAEPNTERRQTRDHGRGQTRDHGSGQVPERYLTKKPLCFIAKFNLIRILSHLIRSRSLLSPSQTGLLYRQWVSPRCPRGWKGRLKKWLGVEGKSEWNLQKGQAPPHTNFSQQEAWLPMGPLWA